jgi:hypothetical protein
MQHQRSQQQQPYRDRVHPRGKPRNLVRPDQAGTMPEMVASEEPIFDSPSTSVYRPPPPPPPLHIPYRAPNGRWIPRSPVMNSPQSPQIGIQGNGGGNSGPLFPQEQQLEFGSIGPVVVPTNGPIYAVGMRAPPPPPPVPAVVRAEQRLSSGGPLIGNKPSMPPNRSKRYLFTAQPFCFLCINYNI